MGDLDRYKKLLADIKDTPEGVPLIFYARKGLGESNRETTIDWLEDKIRSIESSINLHVPRFATLQQPIPGYVPFHDSNFPNHLPAQPDPRVAIPPLSI